VSRLHLPSRPALRRPFSLRFQIRCAEAEQECAEIEQLRNGAQHAKLLRAPERKPQRSAAGRNQARTDGVAQGLRYW
jgi:hypothetical protein